MHRKQILGLLLAAFVLVSFFSAGSAWGQQTMATPSWPDQVPATFFVGPFEGANTAGSGDMSLMITNTGYTWDLCADLYLFNPDGKMIECCACPVKQNGLLKLSINDVTKNPVTGVPPTMGVFKVVSSTNCGPAYPYLAPGLKTYMKNTSSVPSAVPETPLGLFEFAGLQRQCQDIQQNGGGRGICSCPGGGPVGIPQ